VGERCVAVVDTGGTPALGQALQAAIAARTQVPVCYVINTHAHPDHVLGNSAFAAAQPAPQFVAHARFQAALAARGPFFRNALQRDFGIALPEASLVQPVVPVDKSLRLDLGGRELQLDAWPTSHTDNDLTVYDRKTRTLFTADLLFAGHLPVLDGNLRGWLSTLDQLARMDVAMAIPGHGPVSRQWPQTLEPERRYLLALRDETRDALKKGLTLPQAIESVGVSAVSGWQLSDRFHRRNVTAAYAELEWE
jgi:quinoprotein relay system zinc metallohydrolase 2